MKTFTKEHSQMAKGVAVMLLLVYHLFQNPIVLDEMQVNYAPFSMEGFLMFAGFGNICVAMFVLITAYGLSKKVFAQQDYGIKDICLDGAGRFKKLMMNFLAMYLFIQLIFHSFFNYDLVYGEGKQGVLMMLCDALGLSQILHTPMMNETWWYMKLAYIFIFLIPVLALGVKKTGRAFLLPAFLLPFVITFDGDVERYFFVAAFGVVAAYEGWYEKIMNLKLPAVFVWLIAAGGSILFVIIRQNEMVKEYFWNYGDAFIGFLLILFVVMTVGTVPVLNKILAFIGKHSMNIFLSHTIFYMIALRKYIYYFKYGIVTFLILLGISLLFSVVLELIKYILLRAVRFTTDKVKSCAKR